MGTDRPAGRHSSTMRRAIGARTPSVEVAALGGVHQYMCVSVSFSNVYESITLQTRSSATLQCRVSEVGS